MCVYAVDTQYLLIVKVIVIIICQLQVNGNYRTQIKFQFTGIKQQKIIKIYKVLIAENNF